MSTFSSLCSAQALLYQCRAERDEALRLLEDRTVELAAVREEVRKMKWECEALRRGVVFERLSSSLLSDNEVAYTADAESARRISSLEGHALNPPPACQNDPSGVWSYWIASLEGHALSSSLSSNSKPSWQGEPDVVPSPVGPTFPPTPPQSPSRRLGTYLPPPPPHVDQLTGGDRSEDAARDGRTAASCDYHDFDSIAELRVVIDEALAGEDYAIKHLEWFYDRVLSVAPDTKKTLPQQYILLEWKGLAKVLGVPWSPPPPVSASVSVMTTPKAVSLPPPLQVGSKSKSKSKVIFVDASSWGIGFIHNGRWLSWQFKPGWQTQGRDNNWAEMVAVEMGLRAAVCVGIGLSKVVVRSDSTCVIQALETGKSKHPKLPEVMRRIEGVLLGMGVKKGVEMLKVAWVPSGENLADGPSRGVFPAKELRFPVHVPVPSCLVPYVF